MALARRIVLGSLVASSATFAPRLAAAERIGPHLKYGTYHCKNEKEPDPQDLEIKPSSDVHHVYVSFLNKGLLYTVMSDGSIEATLEQPQRKYTAWMSDSGKLEMFIVEKTKPAVEWRCDPAAAKP